jgi:hypothetical protein
MFLDKKICRYLKTLIYVFKVLSQSLKMALQKSKHVDVFFNIHVIKLLLHLY